MFTKISHDQDPRTQNHPCYFCHQILSNVWKNREEFLLYCDDCKLPNWKKEYLQTQTYRLHLKFDTSNDSTQTIYYPFQDVIIRLDDSTLDKEQSLNVSIYQFFHSKITFVNHITTLSNTPLPSIEHLQNFLELVISLS